MTDGLKAEYRAAIIDILTANERVERAVLFGSRAMEAFTPASDVDIALFGDHLTLTDQANLAAAIDELPMAQRVDLLLHKTVNNDALRKHIEQHGVEWYQRRAREETEWSEATIEDIVASSRNALVGGPFGSNLVSRDYVPEGVPVVRGQNMGSRWITGDFVFVTPQKAESLATNLAHPNDIILTQRGTLGQVSLVPSTSFKHYLVSQSQMKVTVNREIADPLFFYYVLASPEQQDYIHQNAIQTGVPHTNLGILRATPVPVPPLKEQRAIAHILGSLDDKIELNRRMNETLEEMARTLFKSWFVDFDPVHAKAALRNHTADRSPLDWTVERARAYLDGMDPSIAALFPDRFVDSELGEIPEGWRVEQFADHISATRGLSYKGTGLCGDDEGLPMHNLNSIFEGGSYKYDGIKYYKGEYREKHLLKPGDLIVTNTEQGFDRLLIGYAAIIPGSFGPVGLYSHHIYRIDTKSKSLLTPQYLVHLFNSPFYHQWISGFANGTTINMLPMDAFEIPSLVIPPSELISVFTVLAQNIHAQFQSNWGQSSTLAALRDTLLPKLISGELRIKSQERHD